MLRNRTVDLINQETEWGIDVSEVSGRTSLAGKAMLFLGYILLIVGVIAAMPLIAGFLLFPVSSGVWAEVIIVVGILGGAYALKKIATNGPRNSLQIDYDAGEVRLGSTNAHGVFARHRVCAFSQIQDITVERTSDATVLSFVMNGETANIVLSNADDASVDDIVAKILAAKENSRTNPVRSRIQSAVLGFEAGFREVGQRVRSRVASRTA